MAQEQDARISSPKKAEEKQNVAEEILFHQRKALTDRLDRADAGSVVHHEGGKGKRNQHQRGNERADQLVNVNIHERRKLGVDGKCCSKRQFRTRGGKILEARNAGNQGDHGADAVDDKEHQHVLVRVVIESVEHITDGNRFPAQRREADL